MKKHIQQLILGLILLFTASIGFAGAQGNTFYYGEEFMADGVLNSEQKTELGQIIKTDSINTEDKTLLYQIRQYFGLTGTETYDQDKPATAYISMIMNIALGLTSFIALVLIIFAFYLMFFQKGEEGLAKAKKILIGVAIALVVMGLSWIIVSFFFDIYTIEATKDI